MDSSTTVENGNLETTYASGQRTSSLFFPRACSNATSMGAYCNISATPCDLLQPCQNNATCNNTGTALLGYACRMSTGFQWNTLWTGLSTMSTPHMLEQRWVQMFISISHVLFLSSAIGTCNDTGNQTFHCQCPKDWEGKHCERLVDYCQNVICENNGVCRSLSGDYLCECLGDSYSGRNCEITSRHTAVYQAVSKSLGYIAILSLSTVVMFIVSLDVLKYGFGIDTVAAERKRLQRRKKLASRRRQPPVIQRFIYVNTPTTTIQETSVWKNSKQTASLGSSSVFVCVHAFSSYVRYNLRCCMFLSEIKKWL